MQLSYQSDIYGWFLRETLRFGSILPTGHKSNCEIHLKKVKSCSCFPELPVSRLNATELQLS